MTDEVKHVTCGFKSLHPYLLKPLPLAVGVGLCRCRCRLPVTIPMNAEGGEYGDALQAASYRDCHRFTNLHGSQVWVTQGAGTGC